MTLDWGDGDYGRTAATLLPATGVTLDAAGVVSGTRVLDVGCGTGNAALAAARRGAVVAAIDPSADLVGQAADLAAAASLTVDTRVAEAGDLPFPDDAFDAAVSVFAIIFAPDPAAALTEVRRVVRPDGVLALTTWLPGGAVDGWGAALRAGVAESPPPDVPPPWWHDLDWAGAQLAAAGWRSVTSAAHTIPFTGASPTAWFEEQERHHPVARTVRRQLDDERWADVREHAIAVLTAQNEDPAAFRGTSRYAVLRAQA